MFVKFVNIDCFLYNSYPRFTRGFQNFKKVNSVNSSQISLLNM